MARFVFCASAPSASQHFPRRGSRDANRARAIERERKSGRRAGCLFSFLHRRERGTGFDIKSRDARLCARSLSSRRVYLVGRSVLISGNPGQTFLLQLLSAGDASNSLSALGMEVSECVCCDCDCRPRAAAPGRCTVVPAPPSPRPLRVLSGDVNAFIVALCCLHRCVCVRFLLLFVDG
jgi:hypothetical protein